MIKTELCDLLEMEYPIIQAPMGPYNTTTLAAEVSNCGGFGIVSHSATPEAGGKISVSESKKVSIESIKKVISLTDKNFGINVRVAKEQRDAPGLIDAIIEEKENDPYVKKRLKLFVTSAGNGTPYIKKLQDAGFIHAHVVPSVYHAKKMENAGCDIVIASGHEGGGHVNPNPVNTMVLIPAVVDAVNIPVIASGGFCDGRGLVSALSLGAQAIYMGTRFLCSRESEFHQNYKDFVLRATDRDTTIISGLFGPHRSLNNEFARKLQKMKDEGASDSRLLMVKAQGYLARMTGDVDKALLACGEVGGRIDEILGVEEIIETIRKDAEEIIQNLSQKSVVNVKI